MEKQVYSLYHFSLHLLQTFLSHYLMFAVEFSFSFDIPIMEEFFKFIYIIYNFIYRILILTLI